MQKKQYKQHHSVLAYKHIIHTVKQGKAFNNKSIVLCIALMLCTLASVAQPTYYNPQLRPKKQKAIPRFPPQYNAAAVAQKKDSITKAKLPNSKPISGTTSKPVQKNGIANTVIDQDYKVISVSYDANGNKVEVIEKKINGYKVKQTIISGGQRLNVVFNPDSVDKDSVKIVIDKAKYKLMVYHKRKYLTSYRCVFGLSPMGQKMYEGDKRTPEGDFYITEMHPHKDWTYFFGISYPNEESRRIYEQNMRAGKIPSGKGIGGNVGIHGVVQDADGSIKDRYNWTDGCIALTTADINQLAKIIKVGTPINIKAK